MTKHIILMMTLIAFSFSATFAQDTKKGEKLYNGACMACHAMDKKIVGPALANIQKKRSVEWLTAFIKNSTEFAKTDADAAAIIKEYNGMMMSAFPQLSDADVKDILAYIESKSAEPVKAPAAVATATPASNIDQIQADNERGLMWSLVFGIVAFGIITWVLVERIKLANYPTKK